jgi:glycosyltransferase involved in cell wall biosynthesis
MVSVSIIIPYLEGSSFIKPTLSMLHSQTFKDFEILKDGRHGVPVAVKRNEMVKRAKGKWLIFIDDDVDIPKNWLGEFINNRKENAIVGGAETRFNLGETDMLPTCNMMVKKNVFEDIGGFDETYKKAAHEDYDFCMLAKEKGYKVLRIPNACLYHYQGGSHWYRAKKHFQLGLERPKIERKWRQKGMPIKYSNSKLAVTQIYHMLLSFMELCGLMFGIIKYKVLRL